MDFHQKIRGLIEEVQLEVFQEWIDPCLIKYLQSARECLIEREQMEKAKCYLNILLEYSWEKLNTGIWQNVKDVYRYLYAYACYLDVLIDCMKIDNGQVIVFRMRSSEEMSRIILVEYCQKM